MTWSLVVPVKRLPAAKSRLSGLGEHRERLALAVAADTVVAALRCPRVAQVIVVTDDPVAAPELAALGARIVPDEPDAGLNPALRHGAAVARTPGLIGATPYEDAPPAGADAAAAGAGAPAGVGAARAWADGGGVGAMSADLPALRPAELARVLDAAARYDRAFLADAAGEGTTLYTARPGAEFAPAFGRGSRDRHRALGAYELDLADVPSLRRDVDTPEDLRAVLELGAGPRTTAIAAPLLSVPESG
ncbi:MAG: 2-phospho-L-lactate guanylyltransferase [Streptosporangiales bacterium]|nr:2-phospho-L-lactate guanylyltransferase [Streptosporangiales bacterium]